MRGTYLLSKILWMNVTASSPCRHQSLLVSVVAEYVVLPQLLSTYLYCSNAKHKKEMT